MMRILALFVMLGCADGDAPTDETNTDGTTATDTDSTQSDAQLVGTCDASHTTTSVVLDTTSTDAWVHYDLDTGAAVTAADGRDIRIMQWTIELASGVEAGGVEGAYDEFDDRCLAPETVSGTPIDLWYDYSMNTHEVTPHDVMYYVKTSDGAHHRLKFDGYYEDNGTVHTPGLTHGGIDTP